MYAHEPFFSFRLPCYCIHGNQFFFPEPINSGRDRYLWVGYILLSFFSFKKKETWREEEINSGMNSLFNSSIVRTSLAACAILLVGWKKLM